MNSSRSGQNDRRLLCKFSSSAPRLQLLQLLARTLPTSPIPLRWLLPLRRLRCPNMAWFHTRQSRLPLLSSLGQRRLLIITHQSHPRCSGLRRMASDRRCLPREPSCRAQRAHRYGAAGIAVAIGSRAAHRLPSAITAPLRRPAHRFTPAPTHRRLASATSARTRLNPTQVQLAPMRGLAALTANKFGLIQRRRWAHSSRFFFDHALGERAP